MGKAPVVSDEAVALFNEFFLEWMKGHTQSADGIDPRVYREEQALVMAQAIQWFITKQSSIATDFVIIAKNTFNNSAKNYPDIEQLEVQRV